MSKQQALDKFRSTLNSILENKVDKPQQLYGTLGIYNNGNEVVIVPNRAGFVYVRLSGSDSEIVEAYNDVVPSKFNLEVLVEVQKNKTFKVIGANTALYQSTKNQSYIVAKHSWTHTFGYSPENTGSDPILIYKRQMLQPLGVTPSVSPMQVQVWGDFYSWNSQIANFPDTMSSDLSAYKPTGSINARYVTIYLDGDTNSLGYRVGDEFINNFYVTGVLGYIPEIDPVEGIPLAAVFLTTGTSVIDWNNIRDIRNFLNNSGAITSIPQHPLDPIGGYHTGTLRASLVTIVDAGNYYTGTTVEVALQEVYEKANAASSSSSASGHIHGLARWSVPSGTASVLFPDQVEYIDNVFVNGIVLDPFLYSLSSGSNYLLLTNPVGYTATIISNYVIAQL